MNEKTNNTVKILDSEAKKTTALLSFLIDVNMTEELTGIGKERTQILNLTRLAIAECWIQEMVKRLEKVYGKEMFNNFEKIKSLMEVQKEE